MAVLHQGPCGLDDHACLIRVAEGDEDAFADLFDELAAETYTLCASTFDIETERDDAMQEAWLRVWAEAPVLCADPQPTRILVLGILLVVIARRRASV